MINRVLLRIKIIQILYSFYKNEGNTADEAEKVLFMSIDNTYDLYFLLLKLVVDVTEHAAKKIEAAKNKYTATAADLNPQTKFIDNLFAKQLAENYMLNSYVNEHDIRWNNEETIIKKLHDEIVASELYAEYMADGEQTYQKDKAFWRNIFKRILAESEELEKSLDEASIYWDIKSDKDENKDENRGIATIPTCDWCDDVEPVISFVIKTIKMFKEENGPDQELMPKFNDEDGIEFARELLRNAIYHASEYNDLITSHIKNWELDRLAFMDIIIMQAALSEIHSFPNIPVNVTLNEFVEISKYYSTNKSYNFINGTLDAIIKDLKKENKIIKIAYYTKTK